MDTTKTDVVRETEAPKWVHRMPKGECAYCDKWGDELVMPHHTASERCESGKHPHCTCDTCF